MKNHTIIGMAGHIDHGKTALIRALTGIQTDQHKEEQERGITIDIGFAYWKDKVTIIDVPGHEKFVRNMVAGVSTIDLFILVIAADDGIMPQTIEHLEILKFFAVKDGLVALNKIDLVDEEWLLLLEDEISGLLKDYGYETVPIIPVSALQNQGISNLLEKLEIKINDLKDQISQRPFRLNVDRSFTAKGFGSVVTGTVLSGQIKSGDNVLILPQKFITKVRGVQVHQRMTSLASCGQRAAINLAGLNKEETPRGTVLVEPDTLKPTTVILAKLKTIRQLNTKIKRYSQNHVYIGTQEIIGKINWYEHDRILEANKTYHLRIKLNQPTVIAPGDAIMIRSFSPITTIAGGKVLLIDAPGFKKLEKDWPKVFEILESKDLKSKLMLLFELSGIHTLTIHSLIQVLFENSDALQAALDSLIREQSIFCYEFKNETHYLSQEYLEKTIQLIIDPMRIAWEKDQLFRGFNRLQISNILKGLPINEAFLESILQKALKTEQLYFDGSLYSTAEISKVTKLSELQETILNIYKGKRFLPPTLEELSRDLEVDLKNLKNITSALSQKGNLKSIAGKFYLHSSVLNELIEFLKQYFLTYDQLDIIVMKDFMQGSRKYVIPILEYLDDNDYTLRRGDVRIAGQKLFD